MILEFGVPDLFINASYPKNSNWANCDFDNQNSLDTIENINFHLGSYTVLSKIICEKMKSADVSGSVVLLNSIYGNPSSTHSYGRKSKSVIEKCRKRIAAHFNVMSSEIIFIPLILILIIGI